MSLLTKKAGAAPKIAALSTTAGGVLYALGTDGHVYQRNLLPAWHWDAVATLGLPDDKFVAFSAAPPEFAGVTASGKAYVYSYSNVSAGVSWYEIPDQPAVKFVSVSLAAGGVPHLVDEAGNGWLWAGRIPGQSEPYWVKLESLDLVPVAGEPVWPTDKQRAEHLARTPGVVIQPTSRKRFQLPTRLVGQR